MRTTLRFLVVFLLSLPMSAQVLTLSGHVANLQTPTDQTPLCGCKVGDPVTAKIELRTYLVTWSGGAGPAAVYPLTFVPAYANTGIPALEFSDNSFSLKIGDRTWYNKFDTTKEQNHHLAGDLQLSKPGAEKLPDTFTTLFTTGFAVKRKGQAEIFSEGELTQVVDFRVQTDPAPLWNTTGTAITSTKAKDTSYIALSTGSYDLNRVAITIDTVTADTTTVSKLDLSAAFLREQKEKARSAGLPGFLPEPPNPPTNGSSVAPVKTAVYQARPLGTCLTVGLAGNTIARNIVSSFRTATLASVTGTLIESDAAEALLTLGVPLVCTADFISLMVKSAKDRSGETQVPSKTIASFPGQGGRGPIRVDVETPTTREAQIQIQRGSGKQGQDTRLFDPDTRAITEVKDNNPTAANRISNGELKDLLKNPDFNRAIEKAKAYLGKS